MGNFTLGGNTRAEAEAAAHSRRSSPKRRWIDWPSLVASSSSNLGPNLTPVCGHGSGFIFPRLMDRVSLAGTLEFFSLSVWFHARVNTYVCGGDITDPYQPFLFFRPQKSVLTLTAARPAELASARCSFGARRRMQVLDHCTTAAYIHYACCSM